MTDAFKDTTLFIGIGAPRTGTKWLSAYFADHPNVLMSPLRVLNYFDARFMPKTNGRHNAWFEKRFEELKAQGRKEDDSRFLALRDRVRMITDDTAYIDYFRNQWKGEKVFVDITPSYATLGPDAFEAMHKIHGDVRIQFSMRNPIERFWSYQRLARTQQSNYDLYADFDRRVNREGAPPWTEYIKTVEDLDRVIPKRSLRYVFFENFINQPAIDALCDDLGIPHHAAEVAVPQNQSDPYPLDEARRRLAFKRFEPVYRFAERRFGEELPQSWRDDIKAFGS